MNPRGATPEWQRRLRRDLGENPARYLDHDLVEYGDDHTDNTLQPLVTARIRGIDYVAVVNAWIAVERKLDRGPRDRVIRLLEERKAHLQETDERVLPDWTAEERRERAAELYERSKSDDDRDSADEEEALTASQKLHRLRAEGGASR